MTEENEYNASSIKILDQKEAEDKFSWIRIEELSRKYSVPKICIERGFEASRILDMSTDHYVDKYLKGMDIPKNLELEEVYRGLI